MEEYYLPKDIFAKNVERKEKESMQNYTIKNKKKLGIKKLRYGLSNCIICGAEIIKQLPTRCFAVIVV